MNFNVSEAQTVCGEVLKLGAVAISTGMGLGFSQRFLLASLEIDPAADLAALAAQLGRIDAPHVLQIPGMRRPSPAVPGTDEVGTFVAAVARTVAGLLEQAGIPVAGDARVLVQEAPVGVAGDRAYRRLAIPSLVPVAASEALTWVVKLTNAWAGSPIEDGIPAEHAVRLEALKQNLERQAPTGSNMRHLIRAAHELSIPYVMLPVGVFQFGWGNRGRLLRSTETDRTPNLAAVLIKNKLAGSSMLRSAGLPVPANESAPSREAAVAAAQRIGFPVVVKPVDLDGGKGARSGITTQRELLAAYDNARTLSPNVMVEQHVDGREYRLLVVNWRLFSAHERVLGEIIGDGISTVRQLIETTNRIRRAGPNTGYALVAIVETSDLLDLLAEQGHGPQSVPGAGERLRLQRAPSVIGGGTVRQAFDIIHPDNAALAERAARVLRMDVAGIDFLTTDITRPWYETGARITEVNSQPQVSPLVRPGIHKELLGRLVPADGRIPVAVVAGAESGELAGIVRSRLARAGIHAGVAGGGAITIGDEFLSREGGLFQAAQMLLTDPAVEAAVLFTDGQEILRDGLPIDRFDLLALPGGIDAASSGPDRVIALAAPHLRGDILMAPQTPGNDMARRLVGAERVRVAEIPEMADALCSLASQAS